MSKTLKIELLVDGKKKTFSENFIPAGEMLEALDLIEVDNSERKLRDIYEERVTFLAKVFTDTAVTTDAIWSGFNAIDFDDRSFSLICQVAGVDPKKLQTPTTPE